MTNWQEFIKKKRIKTRRETNIAHEAWVQGMTEAGKLIKIAAQADMIEAGYDPNSVVYEETYAKALRDDIDQYIEFFKKRRK